MAGLIFPSKPASSPPPVAAPAPMPTPDDSAIQAAKKQQAMAAQARSGRASTMLSGDNQGGKTDKLG